MNNPYMVLEIGADTDDAKVKQAYLAKVRAFPPENHPQRFQEIRAAFETLQSEKTRIAYALFDYPEDPPDFDEFAVHVLENREPGRPDRNHFQSLLAESAHNFKRTVLHGIIE